MKDIKQANGTVLFNKNQVSASPALHTAEWLLGAMKPTKPGTEAVEIQIGNAVFHLDVEAANKLRHDLFDAVPA